MEISARDWALALTMIEKLRQRCDAHNEMLGKLLVHLVNAGALTNTQGNALNAEWNQSEAQHIEEITASGVIERVTDTGASKDETRKSLEDAFADLHAEALDRL
jgi:hypothetical protein